jgi:hypothetical protein
MISLTQLWLPILLGAVGVFITSSLVHMVIKWHAADYLKLPNEDAVRSAMRGLAPGQYVTPHCPDMQDLQTPEMQKKFTDGPVAMTWVKPNGMGNLPAMLGQWFALSLGVSFLAAYVAARTLPAGAAHGAVLRVVATIAFLAYATGPITDGIWMGKPWRAVAKDVADAVIFAFATALPFMWLWPTGGDFVKGLFR